MPVLSDEERWEAWCADFDEVYREVVGLFHTRYMWRAITGLMNNGVPDRQYVVVQNYFVRTYVGTLCTAIRREADLDARTSSMARCLQALIDCPHFATRTRYVQEAQRRRGGVLSGGPTDAEVAATFDRFAPSGAECIDPDLVKDAQERLTRAAAPIRKYTNKVLAHRERGGQVEKLTPSWDQINEALDELGRITKQFYSLREPGSHLLTVTPVGDLAWVSMFEVPWYTPSWQPPKDGIDEDI